MTTTDIHSKNPIITYLKIRGIFFEAHPTKLTLDEITMEVIEFCRDLAALDVATILGLVKLDFAKLPDKTQRQLGNPKRREGAGPLVNKFFSEAASLEPHELWRNKTEAKLSDDTSDIGKFGRA